MLETSARLLRLLGLLQTRRDWTSAELATRLNVTTRTIRNDVARLRALGYPVEARPGCGRRLSPRHRGFPASAAARRRRGGGGRDRTEDRGEWLGRRDRGGLGAGPSQAAADASLAAAPPGQRYRLVCTARAVPRARGGPGRTDPDRERLPGPRAAPV